MKITRNVIGIPLAGLLLVGAAGAVMATSGAGSAATTVADPAAPSATPDPATGTALKPDIQDTQLSAVLDDLVAKGTITAAQKTAILDALETERTAQREAREAERTQLQGFLADGVLTQEEFDQLPADSRLRAMTGLMDDGQITTDELRGLGRGAMGGGRGHGGGFRGGPGGDWDGMAPDASPAPSAGTSG